jgi:hypothetical protein
MGHSAPSAEAVGHDGTRLEGSSGWYERVKKVPARVGQDATTGQNAPRVIARGVTRTSGRVLRLPGLPAALVALQHPIKRLAIEAENPRGKGPIASHGLQHVQDIATFDIFHGNQFLRVF